LVSRVASAVLEARLMLAHAYRDQDAIPTEGAAA